MSAVRDEAPIRCSCANVSFGQASDWKLVLETSSKLGHPFCRTASVREFHRNRFYGIVQILIHQGATKKLFRRQ